MIPGASGAGSGADRNSTDSEQPLNVLERERGDVVMPKRPVRNGGIASEVPRAESRQTDGSGDRNLRNSRVFTKSPAGGNGQRATKIGRKPRPRVRLKQPYGGKRRWTALGRPRNIMSCCVAGLQQKKAFFKTAEVELLAGVVVGEAPKALGQVRC